MDDDGLHLPTVSEKLMKRFRILSKAMAGSVPESSTSEAVFYLQDMQKNPVNQANAVLVLSQFCCDHETTFNEVVDVFVNELSVDLTPENSLLLQACMLGLRNISRMRLLLICVLTLIENSNAAFKQIMNKLTLPTLVNEGDLLAVLLLLDMIQEHYSSRVPDLIQKYCSIVSSSRHTVRKRLYAVHLSSMILLIIAF